MISSDINIAMIYGNFFCANLVSLKWLGTYYFDFRVTDAFYQIIQQNGTKQVQFLMLA